MSSYVPAKIFKYLPPAAAKRVFEKCGVGFPPVNCGRSGFKTSVLAEAWKEMKATGRGEHSLALLDATLQDISDVGTAKTDVNEVISDILERTGARMPEGFDRMNIWEKAVEFCLYPDGGQLWRGLLCTVEARECSHARCWQEYSGLSGFDLSELDSRKDDIADIIRDFFEDTKKCRSCEVEICRKSDILCYVFAELDDALEYDEMKRPGDREFEVWPIVHPFRVILAFDGAAGTIAVSARGRKDQLKELALSLIYALRTEKSDIRRAGCFRYDPTHLLYHLHECLLQPGDQVSHFVVTSVKDAPVLRRKLTSTFVTEYGFRAIDQARKFMEVSGFPPDHFLALEVGVEMTCIGPLLQGRPIR